MITNGRSDDQFDAAARAVADNGISLFAVGECGSRCCEFLQHPHCSGLLTFYPEPRRLICSVCRQKFMSCTFEFIGFSVVRSLFLSALVQLCVFTVYVCANITTTRYVFSPYTVCKSSLFSDSMCCISKASLSHTFPPCSWIHTAVYPQVYLHLSHPPFSYTHTHTHTHTHAWAHKHTTYSPLLGAVQ